ncbi:hypothetical protein MOOTH_26650 [Moorella thermoacetica]|uniref:Uncharacterized protein n=1 Tax=Neomoorella thermoacetica TaxID=1525 RepID=A0A1J5JYF3_NEOTH|nr:hypothetical protein MOOR_27280 [Moorella thermoacetica]OIQ10448.1 hypothetical protein MOOTH_26650 [Moorella thermoacetica]
MHGMDLHPVKAGFHSDLRRFAGPLNEGLDLRRGQLPAGYGWIPEVRDG